MFKKGLPYRISYGLRGVLDLGVISGSQEGDGEKCNPCLLGLHSQFS